jgi:hypothetical protein
LAELGIITALDLRRADPTRIRKGFNSVMEKTLWELRGL